MDKLDKKISELPPHLREYVLFKHPQLRFFGSKFETEEQLMKSTGRRTMGSFKKFERNSDYQHIKSMIVQRQAEKDILDLYDEARTRAFNGDKNAIEDMLKLKTSIDEMVDRIEDDEVEINIVYSEDINKEINTKKMLDKLDKKINNEIV